MRAPSLSPQHTQPKGHTPIGRLTTWALASAALMAVYVQGGHAWLLAPLLLLPALWVLNACRSWRQALGWGWLLTVLHTAAGYHWFGQAIDHYTQGPAGLGLGVLLLLAPVFQPQWLVFVLARHATRQRLGAAWGAWAGMAAWVGTEWAFPKLLGDSLGHGLYPAPLLPQAAAWVGVAGLTALLLLTNEALAQALSDTGRAWRGGWRPNASRHATRGPSLPAWACAALLPALALTLALGSQPAPLPANSPQLRIGMVQANLTDYEARRRSEGSYAVVREILDLHFAMSHDAVERQQADAVLWSETVYPTTFNQAKSEAGAELDREILGIVKAAGVPFVFGTYDRDERGEYNAAAFVEPGPGLLSFYRKTRLFPLTEWVPAWLDGPRLQRWLPWAGRWQPGDGARVFPLRLRDGREVPVLPLICRDDVDPALALAGARLGARAIVTLSNDAWFTTAPLGARLHGAVAAFRSIETGLPQFRVTTNGVSAVIDARGQVLAASRMGERTLVIGSLPVPEPRPTLLVRWGNWVGPAVLLSLLPMLALALAPIWRHRWHPEGARSPAGWSPNLTVAALPRSALLAVLMLRTTARISLLGLGAAWLWHDSFGTQFLWQLRLFGALVLAPEGAAWFILRAFRGRVSVQGELARLHLPDAVGDRDSRLLSPAQAWVWPDWWPLAGIRVADAQGRRHWLAMPSPRLWLHAWSAGAPPALLSAPQPAADWHQRWQAFRCAREWQQAGAPNRLRRAWLAQHALLPLLMAVPAFLLHQHIAYGSWWGEAQTHGLGAYAIGLFLWWAGWVVAVSLLAAGLRVAVEGAALLLSLWRPADALRSRAGLELLRSVLLYLGLPLWLALRLLGA
ncbi:MAG: apolipoprotein N-acyltransferase [Inhella sp.]|uniref:apolipoprotein N-acyltransferase n=1 Tax=Inhella sp. TaxID=1921806 RepID=UPI00391A0EAC